MSRYQLRWRWATQLWHPAWARRAARAKRYKCQALVKLLPPPDAARVGPSPLAGPACRMVVRARHHETRRSKIFSALASTSDDGPQPGDSRLLVTLVVLGDDAGDYLSPGEQFALWRGYDIGHGVVTRRIFV